MTQLPHVRRDHFAIVDGDEERYRLGGVILVITGQGAGFERFTPALQKRTSVVQQIGKNTLAELI